MSLMYTEFGEYANWDLSTVLSFGESMVTAIALDKYNSGLTPPVYWVYFGVIIMLLMSYVSAACVIYSTVVAAISTTRGFYFNYADYSSFANNMFLYEVLAIMAWLLWAFVVTIMATWAGSQQWAEMDKRYAEAVAGVFGADTPLSWDKGVKHFLLCVLTGMFTMISAYAMTETAGELISYFDLYDDDTNSEADDKNDSSNDDPAGTSAQNDLVAHLITVFYGYFVMSVIAIGGYMFMFNFTSFDDDFASHCEIENKTFDDYAGAFPTILSMTSYADCMTKIDTVFTFFDDNGDGYVDRCEDANFQHAVGETKEYSIKFSAPFTKDSFRKICEKRFPYY